MQVEQIISLLRLIGTMACIPAAVAFGAAGYIAYKTPPNTLRKIIAEKTPPKPQKESSKKRIVKAEVPQEVHQRLAELTFCLESPVGWITTGE